MAGTDFACNAMLIRSIKGLVTQMLAKTVLYGCVKILAT